MLFELIETASVLISGGIGTVVGFKIGRKKQPSQPKNTKELEEAFKEVEDTLDPYKNQNSKIDSKSLEILKWNYKSKSPDGSRVDAFVCLKCKRYAFVDKNEQWPKQYLEFPILCECNLYEKSHFHFRCPICKFKAITKTADDE